MEDFSIVSAQIGDVMIENGQVRIEINVLTDKGEYLIADWYDPMSNRDVLYDEVEIAMEAEQQDKFDEMRDLLYSKGFTKEDIAELAEYQQD